MSFLYALATVPLIKELSSVNVQQVWYADVSAAVGSLEDICQWWDCLLDPCPLCGYFPNPKKTWLLVKESHMNPLQGRFLRTLVFLGLLRLGPILGSPLGCASYCRVCFFQSSVCPWFNSVRLQWFSLMLPMPSICMGRPSYGCSFVVQYLTFNTF